MQDNYSSECEPDRMQDTSIVHKAIDGGVEVADSTRKQHGKAQAGDYCDSSGNIRATT